MTVSVALDLLAPQFRRASERWPSAPTLRNHYEAISEAHAGTSFALVELVKSYIESVCRTILVDRGDPAGEGDSTTSALLVAALRALGIEHTKGADRFDKVLSQYNKLCDSLADARNQHGGVAHGRDGFAELLVEDHARLYLLLGDTLLSLLLNAEQRSAPDLKKTREPHDVFSRFNEIIDQGVVLEADTSSDDQVLVLTVRTAVLKEGVTLRIEPSRLLYCLDREAYVTVLDSLPDVSVGVASVAAAPVVQVTPQDGEMPVAVLVSTYAGPRAQLLPELAKYLESIAVSPAVALQLAASALNAFDQVAVLDWATRDAQRARMLVMMKRLVGQVALAREVKSRVAPGLLDWLAANLPSVDERQGRTE